MPHGGGDGDGGNGEAGWRTDGRTNRRTGGGHTNWDKGREKSDGRFHSRDLTLPANSKCTKTGALTSERQREREASTGIFTFMVMPGHTLT